MLGGMKQVTIGVLLDPDLEYGVGVLEGVREVVRQLPGWRVLPLTPAQEPLLARLVRSGEIQGLVGTVISDRWVTSRFPEAVAIVNTSNLSQVTAVSSVVPDDVAVGRLVGRHFCELNVARAAVIGDRATYASQLRREGFLAELAEAGVAASGPSDGESFRHETGWREWIGSLPGDTAVFCTSDALARRFHVLCRSLPAGAAARVARVAGAGDSLTERVVSGLDLTSVPLPVRAIGMRAAARLERLLAGDRAVTREAVAPEPLVVRASTARYASDDEVVARAMGIALQTLSQNLGADELARRAGVSRRTLELRFRKVFGHGPAQELRARKLELARRLLAETGLSVAEVAARCGGGGVQAFTTLFRRTAGCPPAAFRRAAAAARYAPKGPGDQP
jgi:LacI family transcriptional regulator